MSAKHKELGKNYRERKDEAPEHDFFPTYHSCTRRLLEVFTPAKTKTILEPCAGAGDILIVLQNAGYDNLLGCDIEPRMDVVKELDFLDKKERTQWLKGQDPDIIITNPPFKLSIEFFKACADVAKEQFALLWPLDYLHGVERYETIYKNSYNGFVLDTVFVFVRRPMFGSQYNPAGLCATGATSFAWFLFNKGDLPFLPSIKWIDNADDMGKPWHADQLRMDES